MTGNLNDMGLSWQLRHVQATVSAMTRHNDDDPVITQVIDVFEQGEKDQSLGPSIDVGGGCWSIVTD